MKKNISINISGIIFHIEEDAFDQLKDYLDSINRYFSSFNDSQEIIADIESRIAEIFLTKLNEEKQVITVEDVENLKATMGGIQDFQAVEEDFKEQQTYQETDTEQRSFSSKSNKKLYRDDKRKIVGGVCAGIAHYFNVDPLWIRLLFFILLLGSGGIILPIYIVMWAIVPANRDLPEDKKLKKMFRDPEDKVIGGVSSGLANYFGIDVVIIRVLFVIGLFAGFGLIAYIILWIILPEARSVSDKVQMQGDPVTLSNIESSIKKGLDVKDDEEENVFVKILLFPFRLIAMIIEAIGRLIGPFAKLLVDMIRIIIGVAFVFVGSISILSIIIAVGAIIGIFSSDLVDTSFFDLGHLGIPFDTMTNGIPAWTIAAACAATIIPFFFLILLGSTIIARRMTFSSNTGWTLFGGFVISIIILAVNIPTIAINFSEEGEYRKIETYDIAKNIAVLKLNDNGYKEYDVVSLNIRGYSGSEYKLEHIFESQGSSRRDAEENARMVSHNVELRDSTLYFDSDLTFDRNAIFRAQRLDMILYVPYGAKFMVDDDMRELLRNSYRFRRYNMNDNIWSFTSDGLECLTCEKDFSYSYDDDNESIALNDDNDDWSEGDFDNKSTASLADYDRKIMLDPFDEIEIEGAFIINIENSDTPQVLIKGPARYINSLDIDQRGDRLKVGIKNFDEDLTRWTLSRGDIEITILTSDVSKLTITGACSAFMTNYNLRDLKIDIMGATNLKADIRVEDLEIELTGASKMELRGRGELLDANVLGASHLDAYEYKVRNADLEAEGVSSIKAYVTEDIRMNESFISNIRYRGGARLNNKN